MIEKLHFLTLMLRDDLRAKRDDRGATAVEYGMMVALIAAVIVAVVALVGQDVLNAFTTVETQLP